MKSIRIINHALDSLTSNMMTQSVRVEKLKQRWREHHLRRNPHWKDPTNEDDHHGRAKAYEQIQAGIAVDAKHRQPASQGLAQGGFRNDERFFMQRLNTHMG